MDKERININNSRHSDRRNLPRDDLSTDFGHEKSIPFANHVHLPINKKLVSAESESTRENLTFNKNDFAQEHSSFNFIPHQPPKDSLMDERLHKYPPKPHLPLAQPPPPAAFNYEVEKSSFSINILHSASRAERTIQNQKQQERHSIRKMDQYQPIDDNSKNGTPRLAEQEQPLKGTRKKKIGFSEINISFNYPSNQNSQDNGQQIEMKDIFKAAQPKASELTSSFNFALPSGINFNPNPDPQESNQEDTLFKSPPFQDLDKSRKSLKGSSRSNQGENMFALERILEASMLYRNYLKKESSFKKPSLNLLEVDLGQIQKLPKQFFYKPERVTFHKPKDDLSNDYSYNGYHMICKVTQDRTRFYYQDLKMSQLYSMKGMKGSELLFNKETNISKNVQYDYFNKRFYLFSNSHQKILVYSEPTQEKLCEVKVQKKVHDPHLYIHHVNNRTFLLIIGGYCRIEKDIVQGSKFIEIFELMRWEIELKSKVINLITGRINPIVLKIAQKEENKIFILGGYTIAKINKAGKLDYDYEQDMNQSTNLTGLSISSHEILELFDIKEQAICYNHSVKLSNPLSLHDGCVVSVKGSFLLLLPESRRLFQVKVFNKEVNILEGKNCPYLVQKEEFQQREFCIRSINDHIIFYTINDEGLLQILAPDSQIKRKCSCLIY